MNSDEYHGLDCTCETCIQDYPERSYLLPVEGKEMMNVDETHELILDIYVFLNGIEPWDNFDPNQRDTLIERIADRIEAHDEH